MKHSFFQKILYCMFFSYLSVIITEYEQLPDVFNSVLLRSVLL